MIQSAWHKLLRSAQSSRRMKSQGFNGHRTAGGRLSMRLALKCRSSRSRYPPPSRTWRGEVGGIELGASEKIFFRLAPMPINPHNRKV